LLLTRVSGLFDVDDASVTYRPRKGSLPAFPPEALASGEAYRRTFDEAMDAQPVLAAAIAAATAAKAGPIPDNKLGSPASYLPLISRTQLIKMAGKLPPGTLGACVYVVPRPGGGFYLGQTGNAYDRSKGHATALRKAFSSAVRRQHRLVPFLLPTQLKTVKTRLFNMLFLEHLVILFSGATLQETGGANRRCVDFSHGRLFTGPLNKLLVRDLYMSTFNKVSARLIRLSTRAAEICSLPGLQDWPHAECRRAKSLWGYGQQPGGERAAFCRRKRILTPTICPDARNLSWSVLPG
jgi:hypothetical protein